MHLTAALRKDIVRTLDRCANPTPEWLALAEDPTCASRSGHPAHFTASALPVTTDGKRVCLVMHRLLGLWVQPGGHFEGSDESVVGAAARELLEETGLTGAIDPVPALLSRHPGPCRPGAWHFDLQMVATMLESPPTVSTESKGVAWFDVDRLPGDMAPGVDELVQTAVNGVSRNDLR